MNMEEERQVDHGRDEASVIIHMIPLINDVM